MLSHKQPNTGEARLIEKIHEVKPLDYGRESSKTPIFYPLLLRWTRPSSRPIGTTIILGRGLFRLRQRRLHLPPIHFHLHRIGDFPPYSPQKDQARCGS